MSLRPFFSYYGGKWRAAPHYPKTNEALVEQADLFGRGAA